jgi:hypothetical protein
VTPIEPGGAKLVRFLGSIDPRGLDGSRACR